MGKPKHENAITPFAKLREEYNETHDKMLSQSAMGQIANVTKSTISRIENGKQQPTPQVIKAYSDFFKVSTDYFLPKEQIEDRIPNDATPIREIGITEEVIATCKQIDEISNHNENILAVLNSLIGNQGATVCLLENILQYLVNQQTHNSNRTTDEYFTKIILDYINGVMKPQLQKVIKRNIDWQNQIPYDRF